MKTFELSDRQAEFLADTLLDIQDEGPPDFGWKSPDLVDLIDTIWPQIYPKGNSDE